ncbi:hypothetical protein [Rhizobium sp. RM]|uniref:hypothetical protein n=1 Tax=Rhizobium sp. RM TaxID=2748079 RepID=UPI0015B561E4|nr:hypothetical protein [Rhizobium sp. RM]
MIHDDLELSEKIFVGVASIWRLNHGKPASGFNQEKAVFPQDVAAQILEMS